MERDTISEAAGTGTSTNLNTNSNKYGRLQSQEEFVQAGNTNSTTSSEEFADDSYGFSMSSEFSDIKRKKDSYVQDMHKIDRHMKKWCLDNGKLIASDSKNKILSVPIDMNTKDSVTRIYQEVTNKFGNSVIEVADSQVRVRKINTEISSPLAEFADVANGNMQDNGLVLETAEDDRVIGIPYTIANIGADKYYIINGRVYSGWAMWFGLQSIRSPEDYAKNVDLTYNIPFVWAGFQLKSQLSLGASFDIVHGSEDVVTPEQEFMNELFNAKLNINVNKLAKTSFHLDIYGNAYWHIRRDTQGFPDKITILQPERIKVFLDPKTTKVLYYIYLPPILAGMALTPYPNIRENPNIMWGPSLTYPTPIIIDPQDIIHFKENDFTEYPYGLSACKAMIDPATARLDINMIAPMIFKKYAKPLIHWKLDPMVPFQLTKGQIEGYIAGMKSTLENLEPMSDPITSTRWSSTVIGAAQGKAELLTIIQDLDNQIFAAIGVSESYFKPQMGTDRMLAEQDKTLLAAMQQRQRMVGDHIQEKIIKPSIDRYDNLLNEQLIATNQEPLMERKWNMYPKLQWRETFKQDQISTIQNTLALLQAGIVDVPRAARRVGEASPSESIDLQLQMDLKRVNAEAQIQQQKAVYLQSQLAQLDAQAMMEAGGTMAAQMQVAEAAAGAEGGSGGGSSEKKGGGKDNVQENSRYRVTFTNKSGKKQTEVMKGSTLQDRKKSGSTIQKVEPA